MIYRNFRDALTVLILTLAALCLVIEASRLVKDKNPEGEGRYRVQVSPALEEVNDPLSSEPRMPVYIKPEGVFVIDTQTGEVWSEVRGKPETWTDEGKPHRETKVP